MLLLMVVVLLLDLWFQLRARLQPTLVFLLALTLGPRGCAQSGAQTSPHPSAPPPATSTNFYPRALDYPFAGIFCGTGASTSSLATKPNVGCGAGFTFVPLPIPIYTEVGVMGPQAHHSNVSGYVSVDLNIPLAKPTAPALPEFLVGYSRLFEAGHALDYGIALILPTPKSRTDPWASDLRLELRDYWTFANPNQHNVMLRLGRIIPSMD